MQFVPEELQPYQHLAQQPTHGQTAQIIHLQLQYHQ